VKSKIVFIDHHDNQQDDLAWTQIGTLGFERQLVCPFKGEKLSEPEDGVAGVVIYGGSHNVGEQQIYPFLRDELLYIEQCMARNIPVLGICLGGQLIAHSLGATVSPRTPAECEFGYYPIHPTAAGKGWIPDALHVVQAHYEEFALPATAQCLASSERYDNQAFRYGDNVIGLQFHPEVTGSIFRRWQDADWAMFDTHGAQNREQQDGLIDQHDAPQGAWFKSLLQQMFAQPA